MKPSCNERGIGISPGLEPQASKGNNMGDCTLHVEPNFQTALELGMKAFQYGVQKGPTDICTVDAALELGQHVNGLLRAKGLTVETLESAAATASSAEAFELAMLQYLWQIVLWILRRFIDGVEVAPGVTT